MKSMRSVWCSSSEQEPQQQQEQVIRLETSGLVNNVPLSEENIKCIDNTVFFYADVTPSAAAELNKLLTEAEVKLLNAKNALGDTYNPVINLRINSGGGSLLDGLAIVDRIRTLRIPVNTYIDGGAASAATLISVVGAKRFIGQYSWMLIHQLSSVYYGNFQQLDDEHNNSKRFMDIIKGIYKKYTKIPIKNLDQILKHDIWFSSDECLKYGLVDQII